MVFPMVFVQVPWSFNVGKKRCFTLRSCWIMPLQNGEHAIQLRKIKWIRSIHLFFFHHFLNPCGFFPQEISIKSRIVPPKKQISGTVQGEYPWCGWVILNCICLPKILISWSLCTGSPTVSMQFWRHLFSGRGFCAWRRSREIPSSHLQKKTEFEVCEQHRGALNTKHISLHKLCVFCFKCHSFLVRYITMYRTPHQLPIITNRINFLTSTGLTGRPTEKNHSHLDWVSAKICWPNRDSNKKFVQSNKVSGQIIIFHQPRWGRARSL